MRWGGVECLLVEVGLGLLTLNGGAERVQILLRVWHCVMCLEGERHGRERGKERDTEREGERDGE